MVIELSVTENSARVERSFFESINSATGKHRIVRLKVSGLTSDDPEISLTAGDLGVARITFMNAVPIGEPFSVVWDGNPTKPVLRFDGWPGETFEVALDVWGH